MHLTNNVPHTSHCLAICLACAANTVCMNTDHVLHIRIISQQKQTIQITEYLTASQLTVVAWYPLTASPLRKPSLVQNGNESTWMQTQNKHTNTRQTHRHTDTQTHSHTDTQTHIQTTTTHGHIRKQSCSSELSETMLQNIATDIWHKNCVTTDNQKGTTWMLSQ